MGSPPQDGASSRAPESVRAPPGWLQEPDAPRRLGAGGACAVGRGTRRRKRPAPPRPRRPHGSRPEASVEGPTGEPPPHVWPHRRGGRHGDGRAGCQGCVRGAGWHVPACVAPWPCVRSGPLGSHSLRHWRRRGVASGAASRPRRAVTWSGGIGGRGAGQRSTGCALAVMGVNRRPHVPAEAAAWRARVRRRAARPGRGGQARPSRAPDQASAGADGPHPADNVLGDQETAALVAPGRRPLGLGGPGGSRTHGARIKSPAL